MLKIKHDVKLTNLQPQILVALITSDDVFAKYNKDCIITSANDRKHSLGSLHYKGLAIDIRTRHLLKEDIPSITSEIKKALGSDYDVIFEKDHIHIEFDPKS
jgi:hypothetical protein